MDESCVELRKSEPRRGRRVTRAGPGYDAHQRQARWSIAGTALANGVDRNVLDRAATIVPSKVAYPVSVLSSPPLATQRPALRAAGAQAAALPNPARAAARAALPSCAAVRARALRLCDALEGAAAQSALQAACGATAQHGRGGRPRQPAARVGNEEGARAGRLQGPTERRRHWGTSGHEGAGLAGRTRRSAQGQRARRAHRARDA